MTLLYDTWTLDNYCYWLFKDMPRARSNMGVLLFFFFFFCLKNRWLYGNNQIWYDFDIVWDFMHILNIWIACFVTLRYKIYGYFRDKVTKRADIVRDVMPNLVICNFNKTRWKIKPLYPRGKVNPYLPTGLVHLLQMDESISNFRMIHVLLRFYLILIQIHISKQCRPWSDDAFCSAASDPGLPVCKCPFKGTLVTERLITILNAYKHICAAIWQNQRCGCAPSEDSDQTRRTVLLLWTKCPGNVTISSRSLPMTPSGRIKGKR